MRWLAVGRVQSQGISVARRRMKTQEADAQWAFDR